MCEPATIALALSSATAIAGYVGGQQQMDAQTDSLIKSQGIQQNQLKARADQNSFAQGIAARKQQARIKTAAGDAGLTGGSVAAQLMDSMFNDGQNAALADQNLANSIESSTAERDNKLSGLSAPSLLSTGLQIGDAYGNYKMMTGESSKVI